jgi:hypothetical protein
MIDERHAIRAYEPVEPGIWNSAMYQLRRI